ncbi:MAG: M15 family metallopeptidase [Deltaproteobacteria bacterium]
MQYKLLRKAFILLSLVALALAAVFYYVHNISPPHSPPAIQITQQKSANPPKKEVSPKIAQTNTAKKAVEETQVHPLDRGQPEQAVSQIAMAESAEPKITQPAVRTEVSRKAPNTYYDPGYPGLSKDMGIYGQFNYRDTSGGRIEIDPQWVAANIVTIVLPGLNRAVEVNREAADKFLIAFNYIKNGTAVVNGREVSLLSLIKTMDGTFVSRHVNWNPTRGLSNHSWGIAIDINAADHFCHIDPASQPDDPNLILWEKAFKPAGFSWGNSYSDSMHFELLN